jgi:hypothetical protein
MLRQMQQVRSRLSTWRLPAGCRLPAAGCTIHTFSSLAQPVGIEWHEDQLAILSYEDGLQIWDLSGELP